MISSEMELASLITLNRIFGGKPEIGNRLIAELGDASSVFKLGPSELETIFGPYSKYRDRISHKELENGFRELEWLRSCGFRFLGTTDPDYPKALEACSDHPIGLYLKSSDNPEEIFKSRPAVAIVGTRDISTYGMEWCRRIVMALANSPDKPLIISGLAIGADICAHTAALEFGLPTLAVMATGIEAVYPGRHYQWAGRISRAHGSGLVTDFPPGTPPVAYNFLRRNRIIAGLGLATILIESKIKGGGMMTASLAFDYGRSVFALPGRIDDLRSAGCNNLISRNIAEPITDIEGMIEAIGLCCGAKSAGKPLPDLIPEIYGDTLQSEDLSTMADIVRRIKDRRGITLDELCEDSDIPFRKVQSLATILESDGIISIDVLRRCCINAKFG